MLKITENVLLVFKGQKYSLKESSLNIMFFLFFGQMLTKSLFLFSKCVLYQAAGHVVFVYCGMNCMGQRVQLKFMA